jgi:hypothetical protein
MFKSMGRVWRGATIVVGAVLALLSSPTVASAQVAGEDNFENPSTQVLDPLGIDIAGDQNVRNDTLLAIGDPKNGGLAWTYHGHTHIPSLTADYTGSVAYTTYEDGSSYYQVTIGENVTKFDASYNNVSGNSATLVLSGSNYIFTGTDGTKYTFPSTSGGYQLSTIQKPDGTSLTIYSHYCGSCLSNVTESVVSNRGYAFKFDSTNLKVWAVNMTAHNCDYQALSCDGYDSSITIGSFVDTAGKEWGTVTDAVGNVWQYQASSMFQSGSAIKGTKIRRPPGINSFKNPNGYSVSIVNRERLLACQNC